MVDKNNAKADQFNEAYLWTQSVLNKGIINMFMVLAIVLEARLHR